MKSHRGLASVVGAVFLIAIVIGSLSYITYSLEIMGSFSESLITEESRLKEKQNEAFEITSIDFTAGNKLDAVIKNTGQIPLKITTLYIDEMGVNDVVQKIIIDKTIAPGTSFDFLTESIDIDIDPTKGYNVKLITSRGETKTFYLNSANQEPLDIQIVAIPESVPTTFSTTVIMTVVNNMSNNNVLVNLTPNDPIVTCNTTTCAKTDGPNPSSYDSLEPGDVAIFRWVYQLTGDDATSATFQSSLQNQFPGNTDSTTVNIIVPEFAKVAGSSLTTAGIGTSDFSRDTFYLHKETSSLPPNAPPGLSYRMQLLEPDSTANTVLFTDGTKRQWFSANATVENVYIPAGTWNASLTYTSNLKMPNSPSSLDTIWEIFEGQGGGHTFHFNTNQATAIEDSGLDSTCTSLASVAGGGSIGGNPTWTSNGGVNASGAYYFDGGGASSVDFLAIGAGPDKVICNVFDKHKFTISGWFKADSGGPDAQTIISKTESGEGGYWVYLGGEGGSGGDCTAGNLCFSVGQVGGTANLCESTGDYRDDQWHHFVAHQEQDNGNCDLYVDDGAASSHNGDKPSHDHGTTDPLYIGARDGTTNPFQGYIDDIMLWMNYKVTAAERTALFEFSFGEKSHKMDVYISNATGLGVTDTLWSFTDVDLAWSDPTPGLDGYGTGGNLSMALPIVELITGTGDDGARLNFTLSKTTGDDITLIFDDESLSGVYPIPKSSYIQVPEPSESLPVYFFQLQSQKVAYFAYNTGDEGAWLTYQGTRIIFNGTNNEGHYTGIIYSVYNGVDDIGYLSVTEDSPFIDKDGTADLVFWNPQKVPKASTPDVEDLIAIGTYDVTVYVNGYDEDGTAYIQSLDLGTIVVIP